MITDEDAKQLFQTNLQIHQSFLRSDKPYPNQLFRGAGPQTWKGQHPGGCNRHMAVFNRFNIIPEYCFGCYKVSIEPRTVVELFKLLMVFNQPILPNDNSRKCMVETRKQVPGTYKGLIVCRGPEEGMEIMNLMRELVSGQISEKIPVTLKRGCSEYAIAYPEYSPKGQVMPTMEYKEQWREYEALADQSMDITTPPADFSYNRSAYTTGDVRVMVSWLVYAATIGDASHQKIYDGVLPRLIDLERPSPFQPVTDEG